MKIRNNDIKSHSWTTYLNPRNKSVELKACASCGIIKGVASNASLCNTITARISNMLDRQGWIAQNY